MIAFAREKVQQIIKRVKAIKPSLNKKFVFSFLKGAVLGVFVLGFFGYGAYRAVYYEKILPGLLVVNTDVSGMIVEEALYTLNSQVEIYKTNYPEITLRHEDLSWSMPVENLSMGIDEEGLKNIFYLSGRSGSVFEQLSDQWNLFYKGKNISIPMTINEELISDFVATAAAEISNPAIPPRIYKDSYYNPDTKSLIVAERGVPGDEVSVDSVLEAILTQIYVLDEVDVPIKTAKVVELVTDDQLEKAVEKAKKLLGKEVILEYEDEQTKERRNWVLSDEDLISFLSIGEEFDTEKISSYVNLIAETINRPSQNALFQFNEASKKVVSFKPAKNGLVVQTDKLRLSIQENMESLIKEESIDPVKVSLYETTPQITTSQVNDLGIETLIGKGESTYYHSSTSRRHNVEFSAGKLNGVLVPPGEEFSFNKTLGEVSQATGFKQAMIIKEGRTLLDDGGGVCQDSTTLFRAILDAGLPITSWRNHSFRVGYYEQNSKPGFDATVFSPAPDLRFLNDTPGYILIQTKAFNTKLEFELYGTDDGRVAEISNYSQWDASPPPPDLYQDDPTLPVGTIKKVESAVPGLKTKFDYIVTREGEVVFKKTFYSVYQPWQAVYLRGTGV